MAKVETVAAPFGINPKTGGPRSQPKAQNPGRYTTRHEEFKGLKIAEDDPGITEAEYDSKICALQEQERAIRLQKKVLDMQLARKRDIESAARTVAGLSEGAKSVVVQTLTAANKGSQAKAPK